MPALLVAILRERTIWPSMMPLTVSEIGSLTSSPSTRTCPESYPVEPGGIVFYNAGVPLSRKGSGTVPQASPHSTSLSVSLHDFRSITDDNSLNRIYQDNQLPPFSPQVPWPDLQGFLDDYWFPAISIAMVLLDPSACRFLAHAGE